MARVYGYQSNGSNPGPLPYTSGQGFETKNKLFLFEHTYTISPAPHQSVQIRLHAFLGTGLQSDYRNPGFGLGTNAGVTGLPGGQASASFPTVTWGGNNATTQWSGDQDYNDITNYSTLLDNVECINGKHTFTFGGMHQWLEVQDITFTTGISPVTLNYSNNQTALLHNKTGNTATGHSYASFLLGQVNQGSLTQQTFIDTGARIQPKLAYAQDDYAVTTKMNSTSASAGTTTLPTAKSSIAPASSTPR